MVYYCNKSKKRMRCRTRLDSAADRRKGVSMKLSVQTADPAGNVTLLVSSPVPREDYRTVAARLLSIPELKAEQVGFLVPPREGGAVRLEMMGGEFCGNALRCTGLYAAVHQGARRERKIPVEISGYPGTLLVKANPLTGQVEAEMPLPREVRSEELFGETGKVVLLPGIVHGISRTVREVGQEEVRQTLLALCERYDAPAAGVMFWRFRESAMRPAVYVKETDSLYFENSCASGSTAVAAASALDMGKDRSYKLNIRQPGGTIHTVATVQGGKVRRVTIGGLVTLGPVYDIEF